jgi:nucleoside-diphosphate-sugar epimerase
MDAITVVTGGAGFIGSHLVSKLLERGHSVRVVERPGAKVDHLPAGVEIVFADVRDEPAIRRVVAGARQVFHLAANPNLWTRDRRDFDAVNHQGTIHVLDAAISAGAERILHCSTESILTCARGVDPIAEDVEVSESDAVGPYCLSKLRAERVAMARASRGAPIFIASPTMPCGPGDFGRSPPSALIERFGQGRLPALMDCTLNLIDVRDIAEGMIKVAETGQPGRRYLLAGENLSLLELLSIISKLTGRDVPRWRVPYVIALAVAYLSEVWADHVSHEMPQASLTGVRLTRRTMHFDARRTLTEIGLVPRPIEGSLAEQIEWLRAIGRLDKRVSATEHSARSAKKRTKSVRSSVRSRSGAEYNKD